MLGERILDPQGVESASAEKRGLNLLPTITAFSPEKETHRVKGVVRAQKGLLKGAEGEAFQGYEIHMGETESPSGSAAFSIEERSKQPCIPPEADGCLSPDGKVLGTYIHGLFHNQELCRGIVKAVAEVRGEPLDFNGRSIDKESEFKKLSVLMRSSLNMDLLYRISGLK
jgi:adenosylcobyric acid synthase